MAEGEGIQAILQRMAVQMEAQHAQHVERMTAFEQAMMNQAQQTDERLNRVQAYLEANPARQQGPTTPTGGSPAGHAGPGQSRTGLGGAGGQPQPFAFSGGGLTADGRDPNEARMKRVMAGISKLDNVDKWATFVGEVRLMLDSYHPSVNAFLRCISASDSPPDGAWVINAAQECNSNLEDMWKLFDDIWWILRTKTEDRPHDIVLHVAETHIAPELRNLRGPAAWYQLERENGGLTMDRRFEISRKAANPAGAKQWREVPDAIRAWERDLAQWQYVTGNIMDPIMKM